MTRYLRAVAIHMDVVVVDGSPPAVFAAHHAPWSRFALHIPPDPDCDTPNGKVNGVVTGVRHARHECIIIADDDVRYGVAALKRVIALLAHVHLVRPQTYFDPLPWHAYWDTARTLLNRATGGDWPGTLGVRRSALLATGGYAGVLFETLELVRTIRAAGGAEAVPLDLFVRRIPPTAQHFWSQRVRQAYDEFARPLRFVVWLAVLPVAITLSLRRAWALLSVSAVACIGLAEIGRRRGGGLAVFPASAALLAPLWVLERTICTWLALGARLLLGGVPYHGKLVLRAATPWRELQRRYAGVLEPAVGSDVP
ncbi:MAG: glycosyltransferase family 2 protein [Chloroflexota bacterium]|nr:glycosyltransferase family 2 protein [Chloroflexota bacterium]